MDPRVRAALSALAALGCGLAAVIYLEPRFERPGLSLTLCLSAGTEPGGKLDCR